MFVKFSVILFSQISLLKCKCLFGLQVFCCHKRMFCANVLYGLYVCMTCRVLRHGRFVVIGSLSNDNGDGNKERLLKI